jgi:hypothetical protein
MSFASHDSLTSSRGEALYASFRKVPPVNGLARATVVGSRLNQSSGWFTAMVATQHAHHRTAPNPRPTPVH